jgi:hypothetical protein
MRDRAVTAAVTVDVVVFGQVVLPMRRVIHEPIHLPSGGAARRIREGNGQPASTGTTSTAHPPRSPTMLANETPKCVIKSDTPR